jgi:hypothetical protein
MQRDQGYYWVEWGTFADPETARRPPGPRLGWRHGQAWWFGRVDGYYFDSEVSVLSERLIPPGLSPILAAVGA